MIPLLAAIPAMVKGVMAMTGAAAAGTAATGAATAAPAIAGAAKSAGLMNAVSSLGGTSGGKNMDALTNLSKLSGTTGSTPKSGPSLMKGPSASTPQRVNRAEMTSKPGDTMPLPGSNTAKAGSAAPNPSPQQAPKMPNQPNPYAFGADASGFANAGMVPPPIPQVNLPALPNPHRALPNQRYDIDRGAKPNVQAMPNLAQQLPAPQAPIQQRYGQAQLRDSGEQLQRLMAFGATNAIRKNQNAQAKQTRKPMGRLMTYLDTLSRS